MESNLTSFLLAVTVCHKSSLRCSTVRTSSFSWVNSTTTSPCGGMASFVSYGFSLSSNGHLLRTPIELKNGHQHGQFCSQSMCTSHWQLVPLTFLVFEPLGFSALIHGLGVAMTAPPSVFSQCRSVFPTLLALPFASERDLVLSSSMLLEFASPFV